ncbi:MAG: hypothetical protein HPPSJP_1390 [Candidatus Hepatoplasma scabrum]|nr:MAG: hypothetical protein HPPSJP_1390 [Candidatus Hepatoplasma sp.]
MNDKIEEKKKKSRLIRLNKKGIIIISIILILLAVIISLSVYYGTKDYRPYPPNITIYKNTKKFDKDIKNVQKRIDDQNNTEQEVTGIVFFARNGQNSNYAFYNDDGKKDKDYSTKNGPFSKYLINFNSTSDFKWYGFMVSEDEDIRGVIEDFIVDKNMDLDEDNSDLNDKLNYQKVYFINDSNQDSQSISDDEYTPYYFDVNYDDSLSLRNGTPDVGLQNTITWMWFVNNPSSSDFEDYIIAVNGDQFVYTETDDDGNETIEIRDFSEEFFENIENAIQSNDFNFTDKV